MTGTEMMMSSVRGESKRNAKVSFTVIYAYMSPTTLHC